MKQNKKILVLYSELMPYNIGAFEYLVENFDVEVNIIRWDKNNLTPYEPQSKTAIKIFNRSEFDYKGILELAKVIKPNLVFVSGWMDKDYKSACKQFRKNGIDIICGVDNQWNGTIRQRLVSIFSWLILKPYFNYLFVPGLFQYEFARRMHYNKGNIIMGAYTASNTLFESNVIKDEIHYKQIIFVGRLDLVKGIDLLISAFLELKSDIGRAWKLVIIGNGNYRNKIPLYEGIEVYDFLDQKDVAEIARKSSFFILPSRKEPWGLVIHEMAIVGLPLLLSDCCGAASEFLVNGFNGYLFETGNRDDLKTKMTILMNKSNNELIQMGENSKRLSYKNSTEIWSHKLNQLLK